MLIAKGAVKIKPVWKRGYAVRQRVLFFRQLALVLRSGLPLLQAMALLEERLGKKLLPVCLHLRRLLARGSTLAEAMAQEPSFFSLLAVRLTAAGEVSGRLDTVLDSLADYYEQQEHWRDFAIKTALYPLLLLVAAGCVLVFFLFYVLPVLASAYAGMNVQPRGVLALLLGVRRFLTFHPGKALLLGTTLLSVFVLGMRLLWQRYSQSSKQGNIFRLMLEVRFCKLLGLLLDSGVHITKAVALIAATMGKLPYGRSLLLLNNRLERGMDLATALTGATVLLSPMSRDLVGVGAATGCLPKMLLEAARLGEQDLVTRAAKIKEVVGPLLLLCAAVIIGAVVCAVLGPLLEMISAMPE
ncbi:type II secretion system F family protein [Phascolarctobacterium sp.]|uniref:type II secretion system F family protein n=1 Tax=Phascolarctobacterium sp. TaxID=2049039 RepID=UPI00386DA2D8